MATQTRRTTRHTMTFRRTTLTGRMLVACCGLILVSTVAAHAELPLNGLPMNGIPINGLPMNGMPLNGLYVNGVPTNGIGPNGLPFNGFYVNGIPYNGMPRNGLPFNGVGPNGLPSQEETLPTEERDSLPWSTISQQGIGTRAQ